MNGSLVHKCYVERFYSLQKFYSRAHNDHNLLKRAIPIIILWTSYLKVYNDHKDLKIPISMHSWEKIQKRSNVIHIYNFFSFYWYTIFYS